MARTKAAVVVVVVLVMVVVFAALCVSIIRLDKSAVVLHRCRLILSTPVKAALSPLITV